MYGIKDILIFTYKALPRSQLPLSVPTPNQVNPVHVLHPTSWRSILILSSHLRLEIQSALFPSQPIMAFDWTTDTNLCLNIDLGLYVRF